MTDRERIDRLERLVRELCGALYRQGSEVDGNWGHPRSVDEFKRIGDEARSGGASSECR